MSKAPLLAEEQQNIRHRLVNEQTTKKHKRTVAPHLRNSQHLATRLPTPAASPAVGAGIVSHSPSVLLIFLSLLVTGAPARTTAAAAALLPVRPALQHARARVAVPRCAAVTGGTPLLVVANAGGGHWRQHSRRATGSLAMATADDHVAAPTKKKFPPSRYTVDRGDGDGDGDGKKWRICAGAAVLNSSNWLLVGERIHGPGAWQAPQGGVDDADEGGGGRSTPETIEEASRRELHEEVGLEVGRHVVLERAADEGDVGGGVRYETAGTDSWLTRSGFAGQELHWTVYRCSDMSGDEDPATMCDLSGKGGEHAEFSNVRWAPIEEVVGGMWPAKRAPYEALRDLVLGTDEDVGLARKWEERCAALDFSGRWSRDASRSKGVVEGLQARGMGKDEAMREAERPYVQSWRRDAGDEHGSLPTTAWIVTTFGDDGVTPRRSLRYPLGRWEESYDGKSAVFGSAPSPGGGPVVVKRRTAFVAESADAKIGEPTIAYATLSESPLGVEEARRYLISTFDEGHVMVLRRTFWPKNTGGDGNGEECGPKHDDATNAVVSMEIFVRDE